MKKIAVFQSDLHVGGIQKSLVNFVSMLPADEFEIDVFLCDHESFYDLSGLGNHVHIYPLPTLPYYNRLIYFNIVDHFYKFEVPDTLYDVAIDFSSYRNECAIGALRVHAKKHVMWIHNDMQIKKQEEMKYRILWNFFHGKFDRFDEFAAVSKGIVPSFLKESRVKGKDVHVIPNFINTEEIHRKMRMPVDFEVDSDKYNFASMGRLCHQKGFDILLDEFSTVAKERKDVHLYILGDGPDREKLEIKRAQLKLESFVTFLGNQTNPFCYLKRMDGFILDSRYEGQGMVLWEAKAVGLELFFPKRLEPYNEGLSGRENMVEAMKKAEKKNVVEDGLQAYNDDIIQRLRDLIG